MQHRKIPLDMVKNLLRSNEVRADRNELEANRWPGPDNMVRIANAVHGKAPFVLFRNGKRFDIKYNADNVRLKPSTGEFIPMGFFSYKNLTEVRDATKIGAV